MKLRREFIKQTLVTVAGVAIAPKLAALDRVTTFNTYNCNANCDVVIPWL
jgi:hypothetical protein